MLPLIDAMVNANYVALMLLVQSEELYSIL